MNHVYRVIWNEVLGTWQAVAEVARGRGKTKSQSQSNRQSGKVATGATVAALSAVALGTAALLGGSAVWAQAALPTGGTVVAGTGSISQSGTVLTVTQGSAKLAADWQSFNIGQGNTVNFVQPSSSAVALNRVLGTDVSVIQGALNANGQVFLVNPNGVLFTPTAQVNVGSIVASTLNISTADFMAGNYKFDSGSRSTGEGQAVINQGNIVATGVNGRGGSIALIAARIINTGNLSAPGGNVLLGAGSKVTLDLRGPIKLRVEQGALDALISNGGAIRVDGGLVYMSAKAAGDLTASVINHSGVVDASSLTSKGGRIVLEADSVNLQAGSRLDARGATSGGSIEVHAQTVQQSGSIDASGASTGGTINVQATVITLTTGATVSAKGDAVGGQVRLQADTVLAEQAVVDVSADADAGVGGSIDVSSNGTLVLQDTQLLASGALQGGQTRLSDASPTPSTVEPDVQPDTPPGAPMPAPEAPRVAVLGNTFISSRSRSGQAGSVVLTGDTITLGTGSQIDATGATGGGTVLVGGGWQGSGNLRQATTVTMEAGASIDVSATQNGDGGTAVLWSDVRKADSVTNAHGTLLAKGGVNGGDGGSIETSGHFLNVDGVSGSAAAAHGKAGEWLFDPTNVDINNSGGANAANNGTSTLSASSIAGLLNGGTSVTVTTFSGSGDLGELTVNSAINKSSGNNDVTLTLRAANSVVVNQNISNTGGSGKLNLVLDADNNTDSSTSNTSPSRDGAGIVILEANLSTGGGSLNVGGTASGGFTGGDLYVGGGGNAISITTAGGAVDVKGQLIIANSSASGLSVNTAGGNITLGGSVDSGNSYAAISGARTWLQAVDDADNVANSWLATITSRLENALASRAAGYTDSWLGGRRVTGIGTDTQWRWVTGPEASQDAGRGLVFFNQDVSGGGSPVGTNYAPNPFSSGEPNNWNGNAAGALSSEFESVLQFSGSQGKWNDLPGGPISQNNTQYTVGQYVRETNLAPSKLTLNAGAGNVTINGGVGSNKALSSFAVTAGSTVVNGSSLITTGAQTYSGGLTAQSTTSLQVTATTLTAGGPVVLKATASDVLLNATIVNNAASATSLTVEAGRHIRLGDTASISASTAAMNTQLWADTDSSGDGIVYVESAGITTSGGSLTFGKSGQTASIGGQTVLVGGDVFFQRGSAQTLSTGGGALNVYGETIVANTAGLDVTSGNGNVTFHGLLNSGNQYTFVDKTGNAGFGTWDDARADAKNGTAGGSATGNSYLVNITSRLENSIAGLAAGYRGAWIGAYRPDTSSYNWAWADGSEAGQTFFVQTGSGGSGGGNAQPGFYANFGTGEPNGNLDANRTNTESAGQFFGSAGKWNDLNNTENYRNDSNGGYAVNGFVRETNLAASPVTINAGTGAVSIAGGVGASKALASLAVTSSSTTVNGNGMVTTGAQAYSSGLTVNAGNNNLNLGGASITTGGAASFSGGSITTLSNGLALNTGANNVAIITNAVTNNGNKITLNTTGSLTYAPLGTNWTNVGGALNFDGSTTSGNFSGGGDVGWLGINNVGNLSGLTLGKVGSTSGISIDTAVSVAGPIAIYGGNINLNANLTSTLSGAAILAKASGSITQAASVAVTANNGSVTYWADSDATTDGFIWLKSASSIASAGGNITLSGGSDVTTGYAQGSTSTNSSGILLDAATITSSGGNVLVRGKGTAGNAVVVSTSNGNIDNTNGVRTIGSTGINSGSGTLTMNGVAQGLNSSNGIELSNTGTSTLQSSNGSASAISLTGTSSNASASNGFGIYTWTASILATGGGGITLNGTGAKNAGVVVATNSKVLANSGLISLQGTGASSGASASGVEVYGTVGKLAATPVTASTSNIEVLADSVYFSSGVFDTTGTVTIAPKTISNSFSSPLNLTSGLAISSGVTGLTLGKTGNTADITISSATSVAGPIGIYGGNITINAGLQATNNSTITLQGTGNVIDGPSGFVDALYLRLLGGNVTLDNANNGVGYLAASGVGNLTYLDSNTLVINTIDGTAGVAATGVVNIGTLVGDLSLLNDVSTTNTSTTALTLNAGINANPGTSTGGNLFLFNDSVVNVGAGGTARLFSGSVAGSGGLTSLVGSGSNRFRYNSDEATDFSTGSWTALGTGLYGIYREQPTATSVIDNQSMTYGDALTTLTGVTSGLVNGDAATYAIGSAAYSTSGNIRVSGSPYTLTQTNLAGLGYNLTTNTTGTLTVNAKGLTLSDFAANATKVYDGATTATISNAGSLSGLVGSDTVTATNTGATYDDKNVGAGKIVTLNGVSLSSGNGNADAGNYRIDSTASNTADITTKALTISGITAAAKTYDGTTTAVVSTTGAIYGGLVGGDVLAVAATGVFNNKNAAAGKTVMLSSSYSGSDVGNYAITDQASTTANITAKALSVTANVVSKTYDGTTNATGTATVGALVSGDSVNAAAVLAFTNKDAGTANKTVQASGMTIQDASNADMSANYALTYVDNTVSTITPAALTVRANDDARFVGVADGVGYNGVSYSGLVNGETAGTGGTAGLNGTLAIARSGGNTAAGSYTGVLGASGLSATNYTITYANGDYTIVPANQLLVKVTNVANIYGTATTYAVSEAKYLATDGSTIVDLLSGVSASGNSITISDGSSGSATFTIAPSAGSTGGAGLLNAGNYALAATAITESSPNFSNNLVLVGIHSVAQKGLAATATGVSKVYDGNTSMTGVSLGLTGKEAGDVVTVSGSGAFASKNVGNANLAYTISNLALGGGDGNNYYLLGGATLAGTDGTITQKVLTVSGITAAGKTYDGSAMAVVSTTGASYGGLVNGDSLTVAATGVFNDKNAATGKTVTLSSSYSGADAGNYRITDQASTTADISRLSTVAWVGPSTGDWFDPANWAGGAVPDLSNVANVVIPSGVIVTFGTAVVAPAQSGVVNVDGIGNAGGLNVTGGTLNVGTGGVVVDNFTQTGGSLATAGNFTANQSFSQGGGGSVVVAGNTSITDTSGGIVLGNLSTGGNLNVTSQGGAITQANGTTIATTGATALDASNGPSRYDITLNSATNDFGGAVNVIGANVSVADANALTLGSVNTTGDLTVNSTGALDLGTSVVGGNLNANSGNGNITQAGALTVNGSSTLNAGAGNIALANPANDFVGVVNTSGNNVALVDVNALSLGTVIATGDLSVGSTGALDLGTSTVGGSLAANSGNGNITQTGALAIAGASQLAAGTGSIALNSPANDFVGAVNVQGTNVSLTDANVLTMGTATTSGNLTLGSAGSLTLGTTTVGGSLNASSSQGSIAQTGVRRVNGVTTMTAPSGTIPQDVEFAGAAAGAIQNAQQMASNISAFGPGSGAAADNLNSNAIQVTQVGRNLLGLSNVRVVRGGIRLPEGVAPLEEVEAR